MSADCSKVAPHIPKTQNTSTYWKVRFGIPRIYYFKYTLKGDRQPVTVSLQFCISAVDFTSTTSNKTEILEQSKYQNRKSPESKYLHVDKHQHQPYNWIEHIIFWNWSTRTDVNFKQSRALHRKTGRSHMKKRATWAVSAKAILLGDQKMYSGSWKGIWATSTRNGPPSGSINLRSGQNSSRTHFIWTLKSYQEEKQTIYNMRLRVDTVNPFLRQWNKTLH